MFYHVVKYDQNIITEKIGTSFNLFWLRPGLKNLYTSLVQMQKEKDRSTHERQIVMKSAKIDKITKKSKKELCRAESSQIKK